jgi:hypothetical protein
MTKAQEDSLADYDKLKQQIIIDKHGLDEELVHQPHLFQRVAENYAWAVSFRDDARQNLKLTESNVSLQLRRTAVEEHEKLTESGIEARIHVDPKYSAMYEDWLSWKAIAEQWEALRESYAQRAYALKDLVALYVAGYYNTNSVTGSQNEARKGVAETVRREQTAHRQTKPLERVGPIPRYAKRLEGDQ